MSELLALAERVEKLTGPNFAIEQEINLAVFSQTSHPKPPAYTYSLDAAMTLVPPDWHGEVTFGKDIHGEGKQSANIRFQNEREPYFTALGQTSALAMLAVALKARASIMANDGNLTFKDGRD